MILDRLGKCPFCPAMLVKRDSGYIGGEPILDCPNQIKNTNNHPNCLWAWYDLSKNNISAINIRYDNFQLCWHIVSNKTDMVCYSRNKPIHITFSKLLDFELTEENIKNKIKNILLFS
jgi:hypothetical protein